MKFDPVQIITNGTMASATVTSIGVDINQIYTFAIQAVYTGSPVGTFKLQVSCDKVLPASGTDPAANVLNWTDYTGSSQDISAAGDFAWLVNPAGYRWIRLVYTKASGSGVLNATLNGKG